MNLNQFHTWIYQFLGTDFGFAHNSGFCLEESLFKAFLRRTKQHSCRIVKAAKWPFSLDHLDLACG